MTTTNGLDVMAAIQQQSAFEKNRILDLAAESARRKCESLRLYRPMPRQEELHASSARRIVMRKGNRTGGSVAGGVEVARAVTGQDPYNKYPKENGIAVCLGYGEGHIGRVFHRMLFRAGAFDIIRDLDTGEWRAFRPWSMKTLLDGEYGDQERESEKKPAPPLIPKRFIKSIAWLKKSERIFSQVTFTTGWELHAFNSNGNPSQAQGFSCHLCWTDEDLAQAGWVEEVIGRMVTTRGLFRWTALPHGDNDEMLQMVEDAERQRDEGVENPSAVLIQSTIFENKYISDESRKESLAGWLAAGEEVYNKRVNGLLSLDSVKMYPSFSKFVHNAIRYEGEVSPVQKAITENDGWPPDDWTRYMFVDPGHQVCAVLFVAVPPPELGTQAVVYDECYIKQASAKLFGDAIEPKVKEKVFERFYIDMHGASLTEIGSGITPLEHYQNELKIRGLLCEATGHVFSPAVDDIKSREESLRLWLSPQREGFPGVVVVLARCPNLQREIEKFKKKTVRKGGQVIPLDDGDRRANTHAVECLEYAAAAKLAYVKPRRKAVSFDRIGRFREWLQERRERIAGRGQTSDSNAISLGPIGSSQ